MKAVKRVLIIILVGLGIPAISVASFFLVKEYKRQIDQQNKCLASAHYDTTRDAWTWQERKSGTGIYRGENGFLRSGAAQENHYFSTRDEAVENCIAASK